MSHLDIILCALGIRIPILPAGIACIPIDQGMLRLDTHDVNAGTHKMVKTWPSPISPTQVLFRTRLTFRAIANDPHIVIQDLGPAEYDFLDHDTIMIDIFPLPLDANRNAYPFFRTAQAFSTLFADATKRRIFQLQYIYSQYSRIAATFHPASISSRPRTLRQTKQLSHGGKAKVGI